MSTVVDFFSVVVVGPFSVVVVVSATVVVFGAVSLGGFAPSKGEAVASSEDEHALQTPDRDERTATARKAPFSLDPSPMDPVNLRFHTSA